MGGAVANKTEALDKFYWADSLNESKISEKAT